MSDLGPLPKLKAYTITGPAQFRMMPVVWVHVQDTLDTVNDDRGGVASRFYCWAIDNEIYPVNMSSTGGGAVDGYYRIEDVVKIREWLKSNGAVEVSYP